jgi:hypothetical protein
MGPTESKWLSKFLSRPRFPQDKPPLQPKQAIVMSLIAIIGIPLVGTLANLFLFTPLMPTILWSAIALYFDLGISWSFLRWDTRNAAIRGHNAFVIFTVILFCVVMVISDDYEPFPKWAIVALIIGGTCGYSVMGICAIKNFLKWLRGNLNNN